MPASGLFSVLLLCGAIVLALGSAFLLVLVGSLTRGDWPVFVRRRIDLGDAVPVIMYHDVSERQFEDDIRYLRDEGYCPVNLGQLADFLRDGVKPSPRPVLLTFDDGLLSTHQVAGPVLARHGWTAVCFVAPGLVPDGDARPTLTEVWEGGTGGESVSRERNELARWSELLLMKDTGVFEFGSHTWDHSLIFIGDVLTGFADGSRRTREHGRSVPLPSDLGQVDGGCWQPRAAPGRPLYAQRSRMSSAPRFLESALVREACERHVDGHGGAAFFKRADARAELLAVYGDAVRRNGGAGRLETPEEQRAAISRSLARSRDVLRERLGLREVEWLCFPYNEGSVLACRLAAAEGYRGAFVGASSSPAAPFVTRGTDPWNICRVPALIGGSRLVPSLPGAARQSIARVVWGRAAHRMLAGGRRG